MRLYMAAAMQQSNIFKRISILLDISKYCNIWYLAVTFEVSIHSQLCPKLLTHEIPKRRTCQSPLDYRD